MKRILTTLTQKWPEYLLEILVLIIGIYGAFAVEEWNEDRKWKKETIKITKSLNSEFIKNEQELQQVLTNIGVQFDTGIRLMELIGASKEDIHQANPDSLLYSFIDGTLYTPTTYTLQDISNAGRSQLIQSEELLHLVYEWQAQFEHMKENFAGLDGKIEQELVPFLVKNYSMKDIDRYGPLKWDTQTKLDIDKLSIFQNIVFENDMDDLLYRIEVYRTTILRMSEIQNEIIKLTETI